MKQTIKLRHLLEMVQKLKAAGADMDEYLLVVNDEVGAKTACWMIREKDYYAND